MLISKTDLATLKTKVINLDLNKLETIPTDLSKLSNVVENRVVKNLCTNLLPKSMILILVYQALEEKIPNISWLVKKTDYNSKITEIESNCSRNQA